MFKFVFLFPFILVFRSLIQNHTEHFKNLKSGWEFLKLILHAKQNSFLFDILFKELHLYLLYTYHSSAIIARV